MGCTRRTFLRSLAAAGASWALAGCTSHGKEVLYAPQAQAKPEVTLHVLGGSGRYFDHSVVHGAVDSFMGERPDVLVSYDDVEGDLYDTALDRRASTGHLDDLFMVDGDRAAALDGDGRLADLSSIDGVDRYDDFVLAAASSADGRLLAAPTRMAPYALFSNREALGRVGTPVPGDFMSLCTVAASGALVEADVAALAKAVVMGLSLDEAGTTLPELSGGPAEVAAFFETGLDALAQLEATGGLKVCPVVPGGDGWAAQSAFAAGEAPLMLAGTWAVGVLERERPDLDYTVDGCPAPGGLPYVVADLDACMAENADTANREQADAFLEHLLSPEVMGELCEDPSCYRPVDFEFGGDSTHRLDYGACRAAGRVFVGNAFGAPAGLEGALVAASSVVVNGGGLPAARKRLADELEARTA